METTTVTRALRKRWDSDAVPASDARFRIVSFTAESPFPSAMPPPSFDGRCPSCLKRFSNKSSVLHHMNNPRTSCMSWFDFLESMSPSVGRMPSTHHREAESSYESTYNNQATDHSSIEQFEDFHPNMPLIFGSSSGFVDLLNIDLHTEKRRENLYYPFSSKAEWGLVLWLLCLGLSMRAINDFLGLPIVCPNKFHI